MERRLLKGIMNPAMIAVWILGAPAGLADRRLSGHLAADQVRAGDHHERHARGLYVRCWRSFAEDRNMRSARYYKIINEVPAVLMVLIVILVKGPTLWKYYADS
jgi:putative membrane protein